MFVFLMVHVMICAGPTGYPGTLATWRGWAGWPVAPCRPRRSWPPPRRRPPLILSGTRRRRPPSPLPPWASGSRSAPGSMANQRMSWGGVPASCWKAPGVSAGRAADTVPGGH